MMRDPAYRVFGAKVPEEPGITPAEIQGIVEALISRYRDKLAGTDGKRASIFRLVGDMCRDLKSALTGKKIGAAKSDTQTEADRQFRETIADTITGFFAQEATAQLAAVKNKSGTNEPQKFNLMDLLWDLLEAAVREIVSRLGLRIKEALAPNKLEERVRGILRVELGGPPADWLVTQASDYVEKRSLISHPSLGEEDLAGYVRMYLETKPTGRTSEKRDANDSGTDEMLDEEWAYGLLDAINEYVNSNPNFGLTQEEYEMWQRELGELTAEDVAECIAAIMLHGGEGEPWMEEADPQEAFEVFMREGRWMLTEF